MMNGFKRTKIVCTIGPASDDRETLGKMIDNKDIMKMVVKASAIIIESDEITSDAAIAGLNLGLPVIVAAKDATTLIKDGDIVTVDAEFGRVYSGELSML